jgi:hypothetical protein
MGKEVMARDRLHKYMPIIPLTQYTQCKLNAIPLILSRSGMIVSSLVLEFFYKL